MCIQCAAAAATTVGAASGIRAFLQARFGAAIGRRGMRLITAGLLCLAVLGAGVGLGGSG